MAKVITTELQHSGASGANITLDGSKNVTCENNLQVDGNVTVTGTIPADKLTGTAAAINGSNITNLPAANLTGTLPAISGANLTGITSNPPPFRNLIINGAMNVNQRPDATTTTSGEFVLDRFKAGWSGADENITHAKRALSAVETGPWNAGFKNCLSLTNGNQTSGAGAGDSAWIEYAVEDQDIAGSGWQAESASSKLTLSFWLKASVAQTYYVILETKHGTSKNFAFAATVSANTWTKITKTIPGHADISFGNDNGEGIDIYFVPFYGTDKTTSGHTVDAWSNTSGSDQAPDMTSTWWTTNDSTFEITGVQLEVGDTATDFEHRTYADELIRCLRYYYYHIGEAKNSGIDSPICIVYYYNNSSAIGLVKFPIPMRTQPNLKQNTGTNMYRIYRDNGNETFDELNMPAESNNTHAKLTRSSLSASGGISGMLDTMASTAFIAFDAEL